MNDRLKLIGGTALCALLTSCGSDPQAHQAAFAQTTGSAADTLIEQDDKETQSTSTAVIDRKSSDTGDLRKVESFDLFTGEAVLPDPEVGIYQKGKGSTARIDLSGSGNAGAIRQSDDVGTGADGSSALIIFGNDSALATQSTAYIDQQGDEGVVRIQHQGDANFSAGIQEANLDGSGTGAEQTHTLAGNNHRSEAVQRAMGGLIDITLSQGAQSTGLVRQTQARSKASIGIINGQDSSAQIAQIGPGEGSTADVDIDGAGNEARISQDGPEGMHEISVALSGRNGRAIVAQKGEAGNVGSISQKGEGSEAVIHQEEAGKNKALIDQEGQHSQNLRGVVRQSGTGGGNEADIDQTGLTQIALIRQSGSGGGSVAGIDQSTDGTDENEARIEQQIDATSGTDNVDIDQGGSANTAEANQKRAAGSTGSVISITQPGMRGKAKVSQDGSSLKAQVDLGGNSNSGTIEQTGEGVASEATIVAGEGTDNNTATIEQATGGAIAAIDQGSANNNATITQANSAPAAGTFEADIDQSGDVQNTATIEQLGSGSARTASLTQYGRENEGTIHQAGGGNQVVANVQTSGNFNTVTSTQTASGGDGLAVEFQQQGDENEISYEQEGYALNAAIEQDGKGNVIDVTQTGSGYDVSITQKGDGNTFKITYTGPAEGGGGFSVTQYGGETRDET